MHTHSQPQLLHSLDTQISRTFKLNLQQIQQTFRTISGVTDVLDDKICLILQKHQNQFFKVYQTHMIQIQKEIRSLEGALEEKEKQLLELQDEGIIAKLSKRIKELERELTVAFDKIEERDKVVSGMRLELELRVKEVEHLEERLKGEMRSAVKLRLNRMESGGENSKELRDGRYKSETSSIDLSRNVSNDNLFATEIKSKPRPNPLSKPQYSLLSKPQSRTQFSNINPLPTSVTPSPEPSYLSRDHLHSDLIREKLTAEVRKLTKTNRELLNNNVKVMSMHGDMEEFFISCVEETKKLVAARVGGVAGKVGVAEFNREERMNVLLLVLGNDEIVSAVYSMLFKREKEKERSPRPSISHVELVNRVENRVESRKQVKKDLSRKEYRSSERADKNNSFELKLPTINESQKNNKAQAIAKLLKKRQSVNYNDFL